MYMQVDCLLIIALVRLTYVPSRADMSLTARSIISRKLLAVLEGLRENNYSVNV